MDELIQAWIARLDKKFAGASGRAEDGQYSVTDKKEEEKVEKESKEFDSAPGEVYMAYHIISEVGFGRAVGFSAAGDDIAGLIKGLHEGITPFGLMARL